MLFTFSQFKRNIIVQLALSFAFIVSGLTVNTLQLLTCIFIWPFNKLLYRRLNYYLGYSLWSNLTSMAQWWSGTELIFWANDDLLENIGKENAMTISNHKYDIDWLIGWVLCQRVGLLGGTKVVLKDTIKYIPIIGWSWAAAEHIFIKRVWETDHKSLVKDLKAITDYPKDLKYNIVIFPEGTRYTKEKYEACVEVAKAKGYPVLKHHLLPRTKGFTLVVSQMKGKIDYLYDMNLAISPAPDGQKPSLEHIKDGVPLKAQILMRRIPMSSIPTDDEKKCAAYLQELYRQKDEIHDAFARTGDFSSLGYKPHILPKNGYDLYCSLAWMIVILVPSFYYLLQFLWYGSLVAKAIFVAFLFLINYGTKYMVHSSDVKYGSKFGLDASPSKKD